MAKTKISSMRNAIKKLTSWEKSGEVFGFIESNKKTAGDYVYEFFCAMRILSDLSKNHSIILENGTRGCLFPKKPGNKPEWAKFLIKDKATGRTIYQFCLGTEISISDSPLTKFGADISFQKHNASDNPNENDVVLIMDGKYKKSSSTKLDISTIREFAQCVRDMDTPKTRTNLHFDKLSDLNNNCLITNGDGISDHEKYCKNNKLLQVINFDWNSSNYNTIG